MFIWSTVAKKWQNESNINSNEILYINEKLTDICKECRVIFYLERGILNFYNIIYSSCDIS